MLLSRKHLFTALFTKGYLGIRKPRIYGLTFPLVTACIASDIGGADIVGIGNICADAICPSSLSLLPLITHHMFLGYLAVLLVAYVSGFILNYLCASPTSLIDQFGQSSCRLYSLRKH
ncbi:hypothetical protein GLV90_08135 [Staphylococcus hyicus]|nr:hypothetical protein [Staphylococcus hyicus]